MNNSIVANIVKLLSGRVAGQALLVIATPILTRLFLPEHFGVMQIFDSIAAMFFVITCLNYEFSIPLASNQQEASASFLLSLFFTLVITIGCFVGILFGRAYLAVQFNAPELTHFLWLLPPCILMHGLVSALSYWASYDGKFGAIA